MASKRMAYTRNRDAAPLWEACKLQTFYAETDTKLVRYFVVAVGDGSATSRTYRGSRCQGAADGAFFRMLDEDAKASAEDAKAEARAVESFDGYRSAMIPWLRRTGIPGHIRSLDMAETQSSFAVPRKATAREDATAACGENGPELDHFGAAAARREPAHVRRCPK